MDLPEHPRGPGLDLEPEFHPVRLRRGYDMEQVDDLIERVVRTISRSATNPLDRRALDAARRGLSTSRWREGYDADAVDRWLEEAAPHLSP